MKKAVYMVNELARYKRPDICKHGYEYRLCADCQTEDYVMGMQTHRTNEIYECVDGSGRRVGCSSKTLEVGQQVKFPSQDTGFIVDGINHTFKTYIVRKTV